MKKINSRIAILDGFRFFAILLVILYHYFSRFQNKEGLYPSANESLADNALIRNGDLGVQFFFIISGFVILMTLENSRSLPEFVKKRFIRLYPAMVFCAILTFLLVRLLDPANQFLFHRPASGFLPSLTFINRFFWHFVGFENVRFIDGAYWSLLVEVKFYIYAGLLYFFNKKTFVSNWIKFSVPTLIIAQVFAYYEPIIQLHVFSQISFLFETLFISEYVVYFTIGMIFYKLFGGQKLSTLEKTMSILLVLFELVIHLKMPVERIFFLAFLALFLLFIYKPDWLKVFSLPVIARIGVVSYPLYLIHQFVGVLAIHHLNKLTGANYPVASVLIVTAGCILLAFLIQTAVEKPLQGILRRVMLVSQPGTGKKIIDNKTIAVIRRQKTFEQN